MRRPYSEFEHAVAHGRHRIARDGRSFRAVSLTFHSDDISAERPAAPQKWGFGMKMCGFSHFFNPLAFPAQISFIIRIAIK